MMDVNQNATSELNSASHLGTQTIEIKIASNSIVRCIVGQ